MVMVMKRKIKTIKIKVVQVNHSRDTVKIIIEFDGKKEMQFELDSESMVLLARAFLLHILWNL
jgi:hypothetical protein